MTASHYVLLISSQQLNGYSLHFHCCFSLYISDSLGPCSVAWWSMNFHRKTSNVNLPTFDYFDFVSEVARLYAETLDCPSPPRTVWSNIQRNGCCFLLFFINIKSTHHTHAYQMKRITIERSYCSTKADSNVFMNETHFITIAQYLLIDTLTEAVKKAVVATVTFWFRHQNNVNSHLLSFLLFGHV